MRAHSNLAAIVVILSLGATSCQSYSDKPSRVLDIAGNYSSIADCTYVKIESQGAWRKEDLPTLKTTRLLRGDDKYALAKIQFVALSESLTRVTMQFSPNIKGPDYYPNLFENAVRQCSG